MKGIDFIITKNGIERIFKDGILKGYRLTDRDYLRELQAHIKREKQEEVNKKIEAQKERQRIRKLAWENRK